MNKEIKNRQESEQKKPALLFGYIPFDPEKELDLVAKITDPDLKRESLDVYKKELLAQKIGIAKLIGDLEKIIMKSPDLGSDKFKEMVHSKSPELKLNQEQLDYFERVINRFQGQRHLIKEYQEKGISGLEIFKQHCGAWPKGEIEIEYGPVSINLKFKNLEDYLQYTDRKITEETKKEAEYEGGRFCQIEIPAELMLNTVAFKPGIKEKDKLIIHEEMHALRTFFDRSLIPEALNLVTKEIKKAVELNNQKIIKEKFKEYLKYKTEDYLNYLAEEILAEYRRGQKLKEINDNIIEVYLPDIFKDIEEDQFERFTDLIKERKDYLNSKIVEKLNDLFKAIEILEKNKYSRQEIIALLVTESPEKWLKWAKRLELRNANLY